jgi:hypothetical protein
MKIIVAVIVSLLATPAVTFAQGARLQLDHLDRLAKVAEEQVNVTIDAEMLKLASGFMKNGSADAAVKEMVSGLRGIYVRSFKFGGPNAYSADDVNVIRKQLTAAGWARMVTTENKREGELVEIHSWREGNASGGLAILVVEPAELTVVNIVGPIDLAKLAALQGQFGIPPLPSAPGASAPSPPPPPPPPPPLQPPPAPGRR